MNAEKVVEWTPIDQKQFGKILSRHLTVPLVFGLMTSIFFTAIIYYLLSVNRWVETVETNIGTTNLLMQLLVDQETGMRGYVLTGNAGFLEPLEKSEQKIEGVFEFLKSRLAAEPEQKDQVAAIQRSYLMWRDYSQEVIAIKRAGASPMDLISSERGKKIMDAIREQNGRFLEGEQRIKSERGERAKMLVISLSAGYLFFSVLFSVLMAYGGRRQLLSLSTTYGTLLRNQREHTTGLQHQAWLRDGESRLADRIIGQLPLSVLGQNILDFFAEYLGMVAGALYVEIEPKQFLCIGRCGQTKRTSPLAERFVFGEGLVGQAALSQRTVLLDAVSANYFQISSGLGEGHPLALAIMPIHEEGSVNAVLEMAFMRPLEPRDTEFFARVNDNIAAAIAAANYRRQQHEALNNIQRLNEELQAQEEELRVTNDELAEQSRVLEESKSRMELQQSELEQTNAVLQEQRQALRIKNESLLQTQKMLEDHARKLEQASRYKSEFLANMSHELRTPLNSLLILSRLLMDNNEANLTPEQIRNAEIIHAAGTDLLVLINDVLDIAKVEAGRLDVRPNNVSLRPMIKAMASTFELQAANKKLQFSAAIDAEVPDVIYTDRARLEQILRNLLMNALKFTERGSIHLHVSAASPEQIAFAVTDTGIGIADTLQEQIFEPFYQADSTASRKYSGTGLGLSISRQLVGLLGGDIAVSSVPGSGSTFTVTIAARLEAPTLPPVAERTDAMPIFAAEAPATPTFPDDREVLIDTKKAILIIEDEVQFARILFELAHELGHQALVATTAEDARRLLANYNVHAILLDMKLPDGSGLAILERLKDAPRTRYIPVHVISVEDCADAALRLGAIGYLLKPATRDQLREVFLKIEQRLNQKLKRVLVVNGADSTDRFNTVALIDEIDVVVNECASGAAALQLLHTTSFDCVIVDHALTDMPCEEFLRLMATPDTYSFPPVIIYAAHVLDRGQEEKLLRYSQSIVIEGARSQQRLLDEVTLFLHKVDSENQTEKRKAQRLARNSGRFLEERKVLVVDDDVRNIFALTSVLERKGASVEIARNGLEALQRLDEHADIALVLMDMMMPEMDGYQATQAIRARADYRHVPVIAITARAMKDDRDDCLRAGANDYLAKPVDIDRLLSLIQVWLSKAAN